MRRPGGGRKPVRKKPALPERLRVLLEKEPAGNPMGGQRWTRRSTVKLAAALAREGFALSKTTVCRWLKQERSSLRVNRECLARAQHPDRDRQFQRIAALRA